MSKMHLYKNEISCYYHYTYNNRIIIYSLTGAEVDNA